MRTGVAEPIYARRHGLYALAVSEAGQTSNKGRAHLDFDDLLGCANLVNAAKGALDGQRLFGKVPCEVGRSLRRDTWHPDHCAGRHRLAARNRTGPQGRRSKAQLPALQSAIAVRKLRSIPS